MEKSKQESNTVPEKITSLSWPARIFFSLFSASGIGAVLGFLISMDMTGPDGQNGYAVLYNAPIMMLFTFLVFIFITNKRIHTAFAIISAIIWAMIMINI